jgi:hypothetical protein
MSHMAMGCYGWVSTDQIGKHSLQISIGLWYTKFQVKCRTWWYTTESWELGVYIYLGKLFCDLTATSVRPNPGIMVSKGNYPNMVLFQVSETIILCPDIYTLFSDKATWVCPNQNPRKLEWFRHQWPLPMASQFFHGNKLRYAKGIPYSGQSRPLLNLLVITDSLEESVQKSCPKSCLKVVDSGRVKDKAALVEPTLRCF